MRKNNIYLDWILRAQDDERSAEILLREEGSPNTICFLCQQIAEKYLKDGDTVFPLVRGIGPTFLPRPEKQYYAFGQRISTKEYEGKTDDETLWELRDKVELQLELDMTKMRIQKLQDGDGGWLRGLLNRL